MDYVTLAAGKGTRMDNLGAYMQKCMYPLYGIPFLRYSIDNLIDSEEFSTAEDSITIITGHFGEQIHAYFGDSYRDVALSYVEQTEQKGTGHAVHTAAEAGGFDETFIVWLADTYVSSRMFDTIRRTKNDTALTVAFHKCDQQHNERVNLNSDKDLILQAWKGTDDYVEIGLWKLSPDLLDKMFARKVDEFRFLPAVQAALEEGTPVSAVVADEWVHLGGTEPSVRENLIHVTQRLLAELRV